MNLLLIAIGRIAIFMLALLALAAISVDTDSTLEMEFGKPECAAQERATGFC